MATWMGHIRAAERLLEHFPELDQAAFLYGSLAPDFGRPLDEYKFSPPKEISHYTIRPEDRTIVQDLIFYREYLDQEGIDEDLPRYSFLLGYFFHLVLDGLWGAWIGHTINNTAFNVLHFVTVGGLDVSASLLYPLAGLGYIGLVFWTKAAAKRFQMPQMQPWGTEADGFGAG